VIKIITAGVLQVPPRATLKSITAEAPAVSASVAVGSAALKGTPTGTLSRSTKRMFIIPLTSHVVFDVFVTITWKPSAVLTGSVTPSC
jgi:hypothetical protein